MALFTILKVSGKMKKTKCMFLDKIVLGASHTNLS